MKTLLSWLIANIEVVTVIVLIAVFEMYVFTANITTISADDKGMLAFGGALGIAMTKTVVGGVPTKNTIGDLVNLCVVVLVYILIWIITSDESAYHAFYTSSISVLYVSLVLATIAAVFTFKNFGEVVSRRMLYINSNASLFDIAAKYTLNRFVATFSSASNFGLILALMFIALK